jgi:hypothetical protein
MNTKKGIGHWNSIMLPKPPKNPNPEPQRSVAALGQILWDSAIDVEEPSGGGAREFKAIPRFDSSMLLRQPKGVARDTEAERHWKQVLEQDGVKIENLLAGHGEDDDRILPELRPTAPGTDMMQNASRSCSNAAIR